MFTNDNSFGASVGNAITSAEGPVRPVPAWKFGVAPGSHNQDRGSI